MRNSSAGARTARALIPLALTVLCSASAHAAPVSTALQQQLIHAVIQDQTAVVADLLRKGGDPNGRAALGKDDQWYRNGRPDDDPAPPLIVLACHFQSITGPQIIQMLVDKGADVNIADRDGVTPLMAAATMGGAATLLLAHGAKVDVRDHNGRTPLLYAINNRGLSTMSELLRNGADINAQDADGQTALMLAIRSAAYDPIWLFGEDPIQKAKEEKVRYRELIQFLIDQKADVNLKNKAGETALKIATQAGRKEIVRMLRKAHARM